MSDGAAAGTFALGDRLVNRLGYGAMQLAGPSEGAAIAVLRDVVKHGINDIDTSDFYPISQTG